MKYYAIVPFLLIPQIGQSAEVDKKLINTNIKNSCLSIGPDSIINLEADKPLSYLKFHELITSRKISVKKGQHIHSVLKKDEFKYSSIKDAVNIVMLANGLKQKRFKEDREIFLPFCTNIDNRKIASFNKEEIDIKIKNKNKSKIKFISDVAIGKLNITGSESTLDMNFYKLGVKANYTVNDKYTLGAVVNAVYYSNITHSESVGSSSASTIYPEVGFDISQKYNNFYPKLAYDFMNYFTTGRDVDSISISAKQIHRLSFKPYYQINSKIGFLASVGYIKNLDAESISGVDYSAGINYKIQSLKKLSIAAIYYMSDLEVASEPEKSSAYLLNLSYKF